MSRRMTVEEGVLTCIAEISKRDARIAALEAKLVERVREGCPVENPCQRIITMARAHTEVSKRATRAEALSALEATPPAPTTSMLSNLLAVIHRDGGHYEAEHGTEKACADAEATVVRLLATPPAPKVTDAHPLARFGSDTVVPLGLYRVHWKSGGSSLAAIGMMENGDRWIAPTNWTRPGLVASTGEWGEIERLDPIEGPAPKLAEWREITEDDQPPRDVPVLMGCWEKWPRDEWVVEFGLYGSTKGGWIHGRMTHWLPSSFLPSAPTLAAAQEAGKP